LNWKEVRTRPPQAQVLSRETGFDRPYGKNPYEGYDRGRGPIAGFFRGRKDDRLPVMERRDIHMFRPFPPDRMPLEGQVGLWVNHSVNLQINTLLNVTRHML